jgi:hypothetical protein
MKEFIEVDPHRAPSFPQPVEYSRPARTKDEEDRDSAVKGLLERLNEAGLTARRNGSDVAISTGGLTVVRGSDRNRSCGRNEDAIGYIPERSFWFESDREYVFILDGTGWTGRALVRDGDRTTYRIICEDSLLTVPLSVSRGELTRPPDWVSRSVRLAAEKANSNELAAQH